MNLGNYYSKISKIYQDTNDSIFGLLPNKINEIFTKISPGLTMLDVGCGPGVEAKIASQLGINVIGVDLAQGMVDQFKINLPNNECYLSDMRNLPLENNSVDVVFASFCLLHLDVAGGTEAIKEFKRVSRPNSKLILGLPIGDGSSCFRVHKIAKDLNLDPIYFHYWERDVLKKLIEDEGYKITSWEEIKFYDHVPPFGFIVAELPMSSIVEQERSSVSTSWRGKNINASLEIANRFKEYAGVSRLNRIDTLGDLDFPVWVASRPNSKMSLTVTAGKGVTSEESQCSALFEALEVSCAESIPPNFDIEVVTQKSNFFKIISFDSLSCLKEDNNYPYSIVHNFETSQLACVPTSSLTISPIYGPFVGNTNGLASGTTFHEAILHGLFEIIERHSWSLELLRRKAKSLNQSTIPDSIIKKSLQNLIAKGWRIEIKDISAPLDIPTYYSVIFNPDLPDTHLTAAGLGVHLDPQIALNRSILEAMQSLAVCISGAREDLNEVPRFTGEKAIQQMKTFEYWYNETVEKVDFRTEPFDFQNLSWNDIILKTLKHIRHMDRYLGEFYFKVFPSPPGTWVVRSILEGAEQFCIDHQRKSKRLLKEIDGILNEKKNKIESI